jgi:hypothetical protein
MDSWLRRLPIRVICVLSILLGAGAADRLCGKEAESPTEVYIVSIVTSDFAAERIGWRLTMRCGSESWLPVDRVKLC